MTLYEDVADMGIQATSFRTAGVAGATSKDHNAQAK